MSHDDFLGHAPIEMFLPEAPEGPGYDIVCPLLVCAVCRDPADRDAPALIVWGDSGVLHVVHAGLCDRRFEQVYGHTMSRDAGTFLTQLVTNYRDPLVGDTVTLWTGDDIVVTRMIRQTNIEREAG